jgi:hypothetical protein
MLKNKYLHTFLMFLGFLYSLSIPSYAYWEIDQSEFNRFLCRFEPRACNAPSRIGKFATYQECENARRKALPSDVHWQSKTRCVGYDDKPPSSYTPSQQPNYQEQEGERLMQTISPQQERERYIRELEQKRKQEIQEIRSLSYQMKISSPPISQSQKEEYKKALNQAYCIAYNSIQAAEMALKGNFEISENILTDLEKTREKAGEGFDNKTTISCPEKLEFNIPEPKMSIDEDPVYKNYQEIIQSVSNLILEIQANNEEAKIIQDKKQELQKKMEQLKNELKNLQEKIKITKNPKKKEDYKFLEEEAKVLLQQAEANYLYAVKNEERLAIERKEIQNTLENLKKQLTKTSGGNN